MSFSLSIQAVVGTDDIGEALQLAVAEQVEDAANGNWEANVVNAVNMGWLDDIEEYIVYLVEKLARTGDTVSISVSGHANPSTEPVAGWSNNFVSVSVNQAILKAEE